MIFGIGTDVLEVARISTSVNRQPRLPARILGPQELIVYQTRSSANSARGPTYLAMRLAAKEAFSKACGLGMHTPMSWQAIQVLNKSNGQPEIVANTAMAQWLSERQLTAHVSMSDEAEYVVAFVVLEQKTPSNKD